MMTKNLQDNTELPRFTARSVSSMSMPPNESYESMDSSAVLTSTLHSQMSKEFKAVEVLRHGEYHINTHTLVPDRSSQNDLSGNNHLMNNQHLLMSDPLRLCNNPDCTHCPAAYKAENSHRVGSSSYDSKVYDVIHRHVDGRARKLVAFLNTCFPIVNPHNKVVQWWNKFFVISCLVAIFVDPLFFFLLSVEKENKCIIFHWPMATIIAIVRSITDFFYLLHMFLQFRLTYVAPESTVFGAGDLVANPRKIAINYLRGYFLFDLFVVLPLPQVMILVIIPDYVGSSAANYSKNLLRITVLLQYVPRIIRFVPLLGGQSTSGFIFESAWANFVINLLMFILAGHVVGSCWYLFGLQRVNQCLRDACSKTGVPNCKHLMDCGRGRIIENTNNRGQWINDTTSTSCFNPVGDFHYGIYQQAVLLTTEENVVRRYIYALFWGFQQISTLAGNQVPSYFEWEVLFTMAIIGLGLLLFALLIGNMQNFLQALGKRRLDMQLRRRDVEQWMSHRRLPEELRRKIRQAERFNWAATRGVNEEELLTNLPEDIQREIRRHFFEFLKIQRCVRLFTVMDKPIMDAICEKLKQKVYIRGCNIFYEGGPLEKIVFIVRGEVESKSADESISHHLSEGDVCGHELLTWCLTSVDRGGRTKIPGEPLFSSRSVNCLTNVEAFVLSAADLIEVTTIFSQFLRNPRVQGFARYESTSQRIKAVTTIQVAWRYMRRKRLRWANTSM